MIRLDLVKKIFNNQTPKVQLFTAFITYLLYVQFLSLSRLSPDIRVLTDKGIEKKTEAKDKKTGKTAVAAWCCKDIKQITSLVY